LYVFVSFFNYVSALQWWRQLQEVFGWLWHDEEKGFSNIPLQFKSETCVFGWGIAILHITLPNCHEKKLFKVMSELCLHLKPSCLNHLI